MTKTGTNQQLVKIMQEREKQSAEKLEAVNKMLYDMSLDWAKQKRRGDTYRRRAMNMLKQVRRWRADARHVWSLYDNAINVNESKNYTTQAENARLRQEALK